MLLLKKWAEVSEQFLPQTGLVSPVSSGKQNASSCSAVLSNHIKSTSIYRFKKKKKEEKQPWGSCAVWLEGLSRDNCTHFCTVSPWGHSWFLNRSSFVRSEKEHLRENFKSCKYLLCSSDCCFQKGTFKASDREPDTGLDGHFFRGYLQLMEESESNNCKFSATCHVYVLSCGREESSTW